MSQILFTLQNAAFMLLTLLSGGEGTSGGWSMKAFAENAKNFVSDAGVMIVIILGAVMVVVALWKAGTGLLSHGKKQVEWVPIGILFVVGVCFIAGGTLVKTLMAKDGAGSAINDKLKTMGTEGGYTEEEWDE